MADDQENTTGQDKDKTATKLMDKKRKKNLIKSIDINSELKTITSTKMKKKKKVDGERDEDGDGSQQHPSSSNTSNKKKKLSRKKQLGYVRKIRTIHKHRVLRLEKVRQNHEKKLLEHRRNLMSMQAEQEAMEKKVSFECTQRIQSIAQSSFIRLSELDAEHRRRSSERDRRLITKLSKVRERLATKSGAWQELRDPESGNMYYLDATTGHSQWERPGEMDGTPKEVASVTCAICLDICEVPRSCPNGHLFCLECLRETMRYVLICVQIFFIVS